MKFRYIKPNEIDIRVGTVSTSGYSLLLYKNARVDMTILDETVGAMNWQREHKELKGNIYCGISIWDDEKKQWVTKWDCGVESAMGDKEKAESSDSFKRAGFSWGCGRELYTTPFIWIPHSCPDKKIDYNELKRISSFKVENLQVIDGTITYLSIIDGDCNVIYKHGFVRDNISSEMKAKLEECGIYKDRYDKIRKHFNVSIIDDDIAAKAIAVYKASKGE